MGIRVLMGTDYRAHRFHESYVGLVGRVSGEMLYVYLCVELLFTCMSVCTGASPLYVYLCLELLFTCMSVMLYVYLCLELLFTCMSVMLYVYLCLELLFTCMSVCTGASPFTRTVNEWRMADCRLNVLSRETPWHCVILLSTTSHCQLSTRWQHFT